LVVSDLNWLFDKVKVLKHQHLPIDQWNPTKAVEIDMKISSDGKWFYQGSAIQRHRMVKLFSTLIRQEDDCFYLITPSVKYCIEVEDAPFTTIELKCLGKRQNQKLYFRTNVDEVILAGHHHPIQVEVDALFQQLIPYIVVRNGLRAKVLRTVFYELVELLEPLQVNYESVKSQPSRWQDSYQELGVISNGVWFSFGKVET